MVDLPLPDSPTVLAQAPQQRTFGNGGSFLAAGLDKLSEGLEAVAVPVAERQAADDLQRAPVTRDAQGNIVVTPQSSLPILGSAGAAYEHAIKAGTLAQAANLAHTDIASLAAQHAGDPEGMQKAFASYTQNIAARNSGPLGVAMTQHASDIATQFVTGAIQKKASVDTDNAKEAIVSSRSEAFNTLSALAQQGKGPGDETYEKAMATWLAAGRSLTSNAAFGVSKDVMAANERAERSTLAGYTVSSHIDQWMKEPGGTENALRRARDEINDPSLNLSIGERQKMLAIAESRLHYNTMVTSSDREGARKDFDAVRDAFNRGQISAPTADQMEAMHQKALTLGDAMLTKEVEGFRTALANEPARRMLLPAQQRNAQGVGPQAATDAAGAGPGYSYAGTVSKHESGNNPGIVNSIGAGGLFQFTQGTWASLRASHPELNLPASNHDASPEGVAAQQRAFNFFTQQNAGALQAAGIAPTDKNVFMAHFLGSGGAIKFMQAAQTNPNATFAEAFPKEAASNPTIAYDGRAGRGGAPRTLGQVYDLMTRNFAGTPTVSGGAPAPRDARGVPFTPEQIRDNPYLVSSWVQAQVRDPENRAAYGERLATSIEQGIKLGFAPDPTALATFNQLAQGSPKLSAAAENLNASIEARAATGSLVNLPPEQREILKGQIKEMVSGGDLYHQQVARKMQEFVDADEKQIKDSPFEYAVARGRAAPPMPLNANDAGMLATGLHQRADILDGLGAGGAVSPALSVLDKAGKEQLTDAIANGTGAQVQNIVSAISQVPPERRAATIADVGPAILGAANSGDPAKMKAAYGFLGQEFKTNPVTFRKDFGKEAANQLLAYQNAVAFLPPEVAAKRVQGWSDPAQEETRKGVYEIARGELRTVTPDQVAGKFTTFSRLVPWTWGDVNVKTPTTDAAATSGEGLHADYMQSYIFQRQLGMTPAQADANATAMLKTTWGVSGVNGDMVMKHPPEAYYPAIGGSHEWVSGQLDSVMKEAVGRDNMRAVLQAGGFAPMLTPEQRSAAVLYDAPRAIAADDMTEKDIAAGKGPSYYIVTKDENGLWNPLMSKGRAGRSGLVRFYPDPKAEPSVAAAHDEAKYLSDQDAAYAATSAERHRRAWTDAAGNYRPPGSN